MPAGFYRPPRLTHALGGQGGENVRRQIYRDRLSTPTRVIFGTVIGACLGFVVWVRAPVHFHLRAGVMSLACAVALGAIVLGIVAGVWGDRLWHEDD